MVIQIGVGNSATSVLSVSGKTLAITGANFDINGGGAFSVYSTTASKYLIGGPVATQVPGVKITGIATTYVAGKRVQTITFSAIPSGIADGDTLIINTDCDASVAEYNATVHA